ncbi:MAG: tetratricopeptide repeat protein [Vulcanimicrobiaceae bacterium]
MRLLTLALLLGLAAAPSAWASAQTYPSMQPMPRTTDTPTLRKLAQGREVHERFSIGLNAIGRADWNSAAAEFERIVALAPPEPAGSTARYDLAIAYAHMQRYDDADRSLRAALALDPGFLAAMANLVAVDLQRGDLKGARAAADRFASLAPDSARALYSRGIVALRSGDGRTARDDFGKLLQQNPRYAVAHYDLGLAEEKLANYDAAVTEFNTALTLAPSYARARFALGAVLLHQGKRTEARTQFARVVADSNGDPSLRTLALAMRDSIDIH